MIFYKVSGKHLYKCCASYEKDDLLKIRDMIIKSCSTKRHFIEKSIVSPVDRLDPSKEEIIDLKISDSNEIIDINHNPLDSEKLLEYDFVKITYPYLVTIINNLLSGDEMAIYELMEYRTEFPPDYESLVNEKDEIISKVFSNPYTAVKKMLYIKLLKDNAVLNKGVESTSRYYDMLMSKIKVRTLDRVSLSKFLKYKSSLETDEVILTYDEKEKGFIRARKKTRI